MIGTGTAGEQATSAKHRGDVLCGNLVASDEGDGLGFGGAVNCGDRRLWSDLLQSV